MSTPASRFTENARPPGPNGGESLEKPSGRRRGVGVGAQRTVGMAAGRALPHTRSIDDRGEGRIVFVPGHQKYRSRALSARDTRLLPL